MPPPPPMPIPSKFNRWNSFDRRHYGRWDDSMTLENWDFQKISRTDAKKMLRTFINTIALAAFCYMTMVFACFSGIFLFILKRSRNLAKKYDELSSVLRPHHYHQHHHNHVEEAPSSIATGSIREANGLGFERLPSSEPNEEVPRYNPAINSDNHVIPRGVVLN